MLSKWIAVRLHSFGALQQRTLQEGHAGERMDDLKGEALRTPLDHHWTSTGLREDTPPLLPTIFGISVRVDPQPRGVYQ